MKKWIAWLLAMVCVLSMTACGQQKKTAEDLQEQVAGKTFTYEKPGCGGNFTIQLKADGTFEYYEGPLSSYLGMGSWTFEEDVLVLTDQTRRSDNFVNRFQVDEGDLVFVDDGSTNFMYIKVVDGERFTGSAETA